jgi:hypothetical protein
MSLGVTIAVVAATVITGLCVIGLFVWGAIKDGEDQDERDARVQTRSWPRRGG